MSSFVTHNQGGEGDAHGVLCLLSLCVWCVCVRERKSRYNHGGSFLLAIACASITSTHSYSFSLDQSQFKYIVTLFQKLKHWKSILSADMNTCSAPCSRSWSISEDSLRRYVFYASENCIQELLYASDSNRFGNGSDGWKVITLENGVEISKRRSGSLHTFRSRWLLRSVCPQQFNSVASAIDAAKQWDSDLVEASYIKDLQDNLSIIRLRFGENAKPLFRNREFIVYERRETMDDGTMVVAVASLPKEMAAGLHPKQSKSIRGFLLQSGWVVEKLEDESCMVTYVVQMDPAGWLPKCFVNTRLVMIIENLRKVVGLGQGSPISNKSVTGSSSSSTSSSTKL